MKHVVATLLVLSAFTGTASGKNLGVVGRTYSIVEPDFRAVLAQQMARTITPEVLQKKKDGALDKYISRLPQYAFTTRTKPATREVNVKQTLARDVWAPQLDANGKVYHKLLGKKGQVIDPFSNGIVPNTAFLIIDGTNPKHVALAKQVHAWSPLVYIVLGKGDPRKLADEIDYPVDYISPQLVEMFKVNSVPSFVWAEKRGGSGSVQVYEMAEPLVLADVQSKWKPSVTGTAGLKQYKENKDAITKKGIGGSLGRVPDPARQQ